jgi:PAS domain S-box-containing protein
MGATSQALAQVGDDLARQLLDATPDGMLIVSRHGDIVFANDSAARIFGMDPPNLVDLPVDALLPSELRGVHRAHRTRFFADPAPRMMGQGLILRARRSDGSTFPVEISLNPVRLAGETYVVAGVRDVTARVEADEHFRRVLATLDASDDGVFIFDAITLRYSYVNEGAVRLIGYSRDELLTMTPMHLNPNATADEYHELVQRLEAQGSSSPVVRSSRLLHRDGHEIPLEKTFQLGPAGADGHRWVIVFARDITDRLAADEQLRQQREALQEARNAITVAEERDRIGRELNDTVIQRLFGASLQLHGAMKFVELDGVTRINQVIETLDATIAEVRAAIFSLHEDASENLETLRSRVIDVVKEAAEAKGVDTTLHFEGPMVPEEASDDFMTMFRDAVEEVVERGGARHADITMRVQPDQVVLTARHDGEHGARTDPARRQELEQRAGSTGATFQLDPADDGRVMLTWILSLTANEVGV